MADAQEEGMEAISCLCMVVMRNMLVHANCKVFSLLYIKHTHTGGTGKSKLITLMVGTGKSKLVDDPAGEFRSKYESCLLWLDADVGVLHSFVSDRVDKMVEGGLVEEVRAVYRPDADYTAGIRRSIGVPELKEYFGETTTVVKEELLASAIKKMKSNTRDLTRSQLEKIHRLGMKPGWDIHRLDATAALRAAGEDKAAAWESNVAGPASAIVEGFLKGDEQGERLHGDVAATTI